MSLRVTIDQRSVAPARHAVRCCGNLWGESVGEVQLAAPRVAALVASRRGCAGQVKLEIAARCMSRIVTMFSTLSFNLVTGYATPYDAARTAYLNDAEALKVATGPYKAARDAYVAATATYTKSLYE